LAGAPGARAGEEPPAGAGTAGAEHRFDPARLGMSEAELRQRFGLALEPVPVVPVRSVHEQLVEGGPAEPDGAKPRSEPVEPFAEQLRLGRTIAAGDLRRAEYDLFRGRAYRLRWLLSERFERPLMEPLVAHLRESLGPPAYDQTLAAKLGSGKSELRRTGWRRGRLALELRQLHPFTGGPLYLSLSDVAAMHAIVEARATALPQPETSGEWWRRPQQPPALLTTSERDRLLAAIDAVVAGTGFPAAP
jgi:hypothetical protein